MKPAAPLFGLFAALVACSSASPSEAEAEAPTDPIVYLASAETTSDVGIASWGLDPDTTTVRGYDAKNAVVAEVRHSVEKKTPCTRRSRRR